MEDNLLLVTIGVINEIFGNLVEKLVIMVGLVGIFS
jgi:hypothetical protein